MKNTKRVAAECPSALRMRYAGGATVRGRSVIVNNTTLEDEIETIAGHLHVLELAVARLGDEGGVDVRTPTALRTFISELECRVTALTAKPVGEEEDDEQEAAE